LYLSNYRNYVEALYYRATTEHYVKMLELQPLQPNYSHYCQNQGLLMARITKGSTKQW
jgi:hypothetical protein